MWGQGTPRLPRGELTAGVSVEAEAGGTHAGSRQEVMVLYENCHVGRGGSWMVKIF